jgi:hypothetical protein
MIRRFQSPAAVIIGFECSDAAQGEYMVQEDDRMDGWDVSVSESQTPTLCADSLAAPPKGCVRPGKASADLSPDGQIVYRTSGHCAAGSFGKYRSGFSDQIPPKTRQ